MMAVCTEAYLTLANLRWSFSFPGFNAIFKDTCDLPGMTHDLKMQLCII